MSAMVLAAGALLVLGLAFLVVPLLRTGAWTVSGRAAEIASLYREQLAELERDRETGLLAPEHCERAAAELKRRMLQDAAPDAPGSERRTSAAARVPRWALPAAVAVAMPLAAVSLYLQLGAPRALDPASSAAPAQMTAQDIEAMVERLAARMKESPDDPRGWAMLGRSLLVLGRHAESVEAYERALALRRDDVELLTGLAAALRAADPAKSTARVSELAARALATDPGHPAALAFAGIAAYDRGKYAAAIDHWERLQRLLPADSELGATIGERLNEARSKLAGARARKR